MGGRGSNSMGRLKGGSKGASRDLIALREARDELNKARKTLNYVENKEARDREYQAAEKVRKLEQKNRQKGSTKQSVPQQITDFVFTQVGVDLGKHDLQTTRRDGGGVIFDWKRMSRAEQREVMLAVQAPNSNYVIEDWSGWQKIIRKRRANEPF